MMFDLQRGSSCKHPEEGDVFISDSSFWPSVGYFTVVLRDTRMPDKPLRAFPFQFLDENKCVEESLPKVSSSSLPSYVMPIGQVKLKYSHE
jgi:hypothetical protein